MDAFGFWGFDCNLEELCVGMLHALGVLNVGVFNFSFGPDLIKCTGVY